MSTNGLAMAQFLQGELAQMARYCDLSYLGHVNGMEEFSEAFAYILSFEDILKERHLPKNTTLDQFDKYAYDRPEDGFPLLQFYGNGAKYLQMKKGGWNKFLNDYHTTFMKISEHADRRLTLGDGPTAKELNKMELYCPPAEMLKGIIQYVYLNEDSDSCTKFTDHLFLPIDFPDDKDKMCKMFVAKRTFQMFFVQFNEKGKIKSILTYTDGEEEIVYTKIRFYRKDARGRIVLREDRYVTDVEWEDEDKDEEASNFLVRTYVTDRNTGVREIISGKFYDKGLENELDMKDECDFIGKKLADCYELEDMSNVKNCKPTASSTKVEEWINIYLMINKKVDPSLVKEYKKIMGCE